MTMRDMLNDKNILAKTKLNHGNMLYNMAIVIPFNMHGIQPIPIADPLALPSICFKLQGKQTLNTINKRLACKK